MSLILYPNIGATNQIIIIWFNLYLIITSENWTYPLESYYILQTIIDSFELPKMGSKKNDTEENAGLFPLACYPFLCNSFANRFGTPTFWTMETTLQCIVKDLILVIPFIIERLGFHRLLSLVSVGSRRILLVIEWGFFPFFFIFELSPSPVDCSFHYINQKS